MNKIIFTILLFNLLSIAFAQDFKLEAKLEKIDESGFYKIKLSPELISAMENFPADIRIFDEENNEIPYIFKNYEDSKLAETLKYRKFQYSKIKTSNKHKVISIVNNKNKIFSRFYILYKNGQNAYNLKLYGGNEKNKLKEIATTAKTLRYNNLGEILELIDFQPCKYKYYRIQIDKYSTKYPQISKFGYIESTIPGKAYLKLENPDITQNDIKDKKISRIKISYDSPQSIDMININISNIDFYYRNTRIQIKDSAVHKKKKNYYYRTLKSFKLNSDCMPIVLLNNFRAKTFYLEIENKDNTALRVDSIECYQKKYYLITKLEKDKKYFLRVGNAQTQKPEYDLQYFTDKIPKHLKVAEITGISQINYLKNVENKGFQPDKKIIWIVIILIAGILLYITLRMLNKTDNIN
ncbi:MAG: hypothetical protein L3J74_08435 [Bacteroidales bacterium]|nr:hypothetical protein [Bacteroidales bacterium]